MKLPEQQRAAIIESDAVACAETRLLWERVERKEITPARAGRLLHNIAGHALQRWRERRSDQPYRSGKGQ